MSDKIKCPICGTRFSKWVAETYGPYCQACSGTVIQLNVILAAKAAISPNLKSYLYWKEKIESIMLKEAVVLAQFQPDSLPSGINELVDKTRNLQDRES